MGVSTKWCCVVSSTDLNRNSSVQAVCVQVAALDNIQSFATFVKRIVVINWGSLIRHSVYRVQRIGFLSNVRVSVCVCVCVLTNINSVVCRLLEKRVWL